MFTNLVGSLTAEYIEANGSISAEFSTSEARWDRKKAILTEASACLPEDARWVAWVCDTCCRHNKDYPVHVSIETTGFMPIGEGQLLFDALGARDTLLLGNERQMVRG